MFTLPVLGGADLRFWIARMADDESFNDYDIGELLSAPERNSPKIAFELNFGIAKIKFG